jgi:hypothetical protein
MVSVEAPSDLARIAELCAANGAIEARKLAYRFASHAYA